MADIKSFTMEEVDAEIMQIVQGQGTGGEKQGRLPSIVQAGMDRINAKKAGAETINANNEA